MTDPKNIPHLISLLDDDNTTVQEQVIKELTAFGPVLLEEFRRRKFPLTSSQRSHLNIIFQGQKRLNLRQAWQLWNHKKTDMEKLEAAVTALSDYLDNSAKAVPVNDMLDNCALAYRKKNRSKDAEQLAKFLFKDKALTGNEEDYYNPQNSNLRYVIRKKKGIPISLSTIYMLIGARLGISIEGCNFPGHFLARISLPERSAFVDCFNGGQVIIEEDLLNIREEMNYGIADILEEKASAETIVRRFLANLIRAYQIREDHDHAEMMIALFKDMDEATSIRFADDITPEAIIGEYEPFFKKGQVVFHKRYGYRGIIVDIDPQCEATDDWYYGNQTQPSRNQSWYHVLVSGSDQVTYVAETNLDEDESKEPVKHPLLSYFFVRSKDGIYIRNNNPWPETDF